MKSDGYTKSVLTGKGCESKETDYVKIIQTEDQLVGKYNKYPDIASTAKDVVHFCKIVCFAEKDRKLDVVQMKKELVEKLRPSLKRVTSISESCLNASPRFSTIARHSSISLIDQRF